MNFKYLAAVVMVAALSGCASKSDVAYNSIQLQTAEERITSLEGRIQQLEQAKERTRIDEATRYCFTNGQAYSEGAILAGRICQRQNGSVVYRDGKPVIYPLVWTPWKYN